MSSILTITILTLLNDRPTMSDIVTYMDMEALLLMFSMMIVVAVLTETGVFDYLAYYSFKVGIISLHKDSLKVFSSNR